MSNVSIFINILERSRYSEYRLIFFPSKSSNSKYKTLQSDNYDSNYFQSRIIIEKLNISIPMNNSIKIKENQLNKAK